MRTAPWLTFIGRLTPGRCIKRLIQSSPRIAAQFPTPLIAGLFARWLNVIPLRRSGLWWRWTMIRVGATTAINLSRSFGEGLLARVMKDEAKARAAFSKLALSRRKSCKRSQTMDLRFACSA